jgi:hypothetical protein
MHSADRVLAQYQDLKPGDSMRLGENGPVLEAAVLEPGHALVFRSQDGAWVWSFGLYPRGQSTRLVSRNRIRQPDPSPLSRLFTLYVMEPGSVPFNVSLLEFPPLAAGVSRGAKASAAPSWVASADAAPGCSAGGGGGRSEVRRPVAAGPGPG